MRPNTPTSALAPPATAQQARFFEAEGYLILPDVFAPADLDPLRAALSAEIKRKARRMQAEGRLKEIYDGQDFDHQLAAIHRDSPPAGEEIMQHLEGQRGGGYHAPELFDVLAHPKLLAKVASLLGTEEVVASSVYRIRPKLPKIGRGVVPWHQDSAYFSRHCEQHLIITCWIPLVDATVENGCMQILPRTHQGDLALHHTGGNNGFLVIKDRDLPADPQRAITASCPKGGVVFMTNRTPHCSTPNHSDHIRWSLDLRYQSADVPNNLGLWPELAGAADGSFHEKVTVACYPPDADFVVQSRNRAAVTTYDDYVSRREAYEKAQINFSARARWPDGKK